MLRNTRKGVNILADRSRLMPGSSDCYNAFMNDDIRLPIVSGMFYPDQPDSLRNLLGTFVEMSEPPKKTRLSSSMGLVVPHAGYAYSGRIAADGFAAAAHYGRPDVVVILGASHTGVGPWFALSPHLAWQTPLGQSPVNVDVIAALANEGFMCDTASFEREHSIEVQLPFIQSTWGMEMPIVPICVSSARLTEVQDAAEALSKALGESHALIIASSDFTHYETDSHARSADAEALDRILTLDVPEFRQLCTERHLTICGTTAIEVLMSMAASHQWDNTQTVSYATSGDVTGDLSSVVGYASVLMTKENYG